MATQQQPDAGRSYGAAPGRFDTSPRTAPGLELVPIDPELSSVEDPRTYRRKHGPLEPDHRRKKAVRIIPRPHKAKPRVAGPSAEQPKQGGHWRADGTARNTTGRMGGGSPKGIRGPRPAPIVAAIQLEHAGHAGELIRRQRRALGRTADETSIIVDVWASTLVGYERGKDMKVSTLLRIADRLGLRVTVSAK